LAEKTWCRLGFIPVLVFDCVALQLKEGISSHFFVAIFPYGVLLR
jgi:hypothetical protein